MAFRTNDLCEAAKVLGGRGLILGESTSSPKLVVFLPPIEIVVHENNSPAMVVYGMTLYWPLKAGAETVVDNLPIFGQLHTALAHPHMHVHSVFSASSFCMGSNYRGIELSSKSGTATDVIATAMATMKDYYAGSSYRRALSQLPAEVPSMACRCIGGGRYLCHGCSDDMPYAVSRAGYVSSAASVSCTKCGKTESGETVWVNGAPHCTSCAVWYDGTGYLREDCVNAAVIGGKETIPAVLAVKCQVCRERVKSDWVSLEYVKVCPRVDCGGKQERAQ